MAKRMKAWRGWQEVDMEGRAWGHTYPFLIRAQDGSFRVACVEVREVVGAKKPAKKKGVKR